MKLGQMTQAFVTWGLKLLSFFQAANFASGFTILMVHTGAERKSNHPWNISTMKKRILTEGKTHLKSIASTSKVCFPSWSIPIS